MLLGQRHEWQCLGAQWAVPQSGRLSWAVIVPGLRLWAVAASWHKQLRLGTEFEVPIRSWLGTLPPWQLLALIGLTAVVSCFVPGRVPAEAAVGVTIVVAVGVVMCLPDGGHGV